MKYRIEKEVPVSKEGRLWLLLHGSKPDRMLTQEDDFHHSVVTARFGEDRRANERGA